MSARPRPLTTTTLKPHTLVLAALALSAFAGCHAPPPIYMVEAIPESCDVHGAPPEQRLEVPPPAPSEDSVWQAGYWNWQENDYHWVDGCWTDPRPGYLYVEPQYLFVAGSWTYRPPYWQRRWRRGRRHGRRHFRGRREVRTHIVKSHGAGKHHGKHGAPTAASRAAPPHVHKAPPAAAAAGPVVHHAPPASRESSPPVDIHDPGIEPGDGTVAALHAGNGEKVRARSVRPARTGDARLVGRMRPPAIERKKGPFDRREVQRPVRRTIRILPPGHESMPEYELVGEDGPANDTVKVASLRQHPDFRGVKSGRMSFGDDPNARPVPHRYRTDHTGAIVLHSQGHSRRQRPHRVSSRPWPRQDRARRFLMRNPGWHHAARVPPHRAAVRPRPNHRPGVGRHGHRRHVAPFRGSRVHRPVHVRRVAHRPASRQRVFRTAAHRPRVHRHPRVHRPVHRPAVRRPVSHRPRVHHSRPAHRPANHVQRHSAPRTQRAHRGGGRGGHRAVRGGRRRR